MKVRIARNSDIIQNTLGTIFRNNFREVTFVSVILHAGVVSQKYRPTVRYSTRHFTRNYAIGTCAMQVFPFVQIIRKHSIKKNYYYLLPRTKFKLTNSLFSNTLNVNINYIAN